MSREKQHTEKIWVNKMLEQILHDLAKKIAQKRGFHTPYDILVLPELPLDSKNRERIVIIKAGTPPQIVVSRLYIEACVGMKNNRDKTILLPSLRETIERCLEFLPKMHHTLTVVPIAEAVALRKDSKRWMKALAPDLRTELAESNFEWSYSVTVTDKYTKTSVTKHGVDINEIKNQAKKTLSKLIIEDEEMEAWREEQINKGIVAKMETKPNSVELTVGEGRIETTLGY